MVVGLSVKDTESNLCMRGMMKIGMGPETKVDYEEAEGWDETQHKRVKHTCTILCLKVGVGNRYWIGGQNCMGDEALERRRWSHFSRWHMAVVVWTLY